MACGAAWARVGIARGDDKLVDTFLGARAATLLTLWRNLLLEVTPSSLVDHAVSTATEEMTLHVGSDVDLEVGSSLHNPRRSRN